MLKIFLMGNAKNGYFKEDIMRRGFFLLLAFVLFVSAMPNIKEGKVELPYSEFKNLVDSIEKAKRDSSYVLMKGFTYKVYYSNSDKLPLYIECEMEGIGKGYKEIVFNNSSMPVESIYIDKENVSILPSNTLKIKTKKRGKFKLVIKSYINLKKDANRIEFYLPYSNFPVNRIYLTLPKNKFLVNLYDNNVVINKKVKKKKEVYTIIPGNTGQYSGLLYLNTYKIRVNLIDKKITSQKGKLSVTAQNNFLFSKNGTFLKEILYIKPYNGGFNSISLKRGNGWYIKNINPYVKFEEKKDKYVLKWDTWNIDPIKLTIEWGIDSFEYIKDVGIPLTGKFNMYVGVFSDYDVICNIDSIYGLLKDDPSSLPYGWDKNRLISLSARLRDNTYYILPSVSYQETAPSLNAICERCNVLSVIYDNGVCLTRYSLYIKNNNEKYLKIYGKDILTAEVDGENVKIIKGVGDTLLIPLIQGSINVGFTVDFITKRKFSLNNFLMPINMNFPSFNIPVQTCDMELYIPNSKKLKWVRGDWHIKKETQKDEVALAEGMPAMKRKSAVDNVQEAVVGQEWDKNYKDNVIPVSFNIERKGERYLFTSTPLSGNIGKMKFYLIGNLFSIFVFFILFLLGIGIVVGSFYMSFYLSLAIFSLFTIVCIVVSWWYIFLPLIMVVVFMLFRERYT